MREIKFRAWDTVSKKIYSVELIDFFEGRIELMCDGLRDRVNEGQARCMQYTGLKDKNGKEIYGGDIIKIILEDYRHPISNLEGDDVYPPEVENICEIRYRNSRGFVALVRNKPYRGKVLNLKDGCDEVIGNIYENPELLKDKHE